MLIYIKSLNVSDYLKSDYTQSCTASLLFDSSWVQLVQNSVNLFTIPMLQYSLFWKMRRAKLIHPIRVQKITLNALLIYKISSYVHNALFYIMYF